MSGHTSAMLPFSFLVLYSARAWGLFQWAGSCWRQTRADRALKRGQGGLFLMSLSSSKPIPHSLAHCRVLLDQDAVDRRSVLMWTTSIADVLGVGKRSPPFIWVNSCEGQCLPMCNKAAQTLLQHPAFCGICYLRWGFKVFGHVYTARGQRLCAFPIHPENE